MTKKELQKISLQYRTLASQMLKINSQEEMYCIQQFFDFINETSFLMSYIEECITEEYDFKSIFEEKDWRDILHLPSNQKELISYGFQLIKYILDGPKQLIGICMGYTSSNKFSDNIEAFMRKSIEPFVVAVRTYIELNFIDADDENANLDKTVKTVFLSYCQKDKDIADCIDEKIGHILEGKATLSRDIRDVEYHESFKKFMQSIENHDYVISIISDNYLKSRNCMYEMLEVVKDSKFSQRLLFIVGKDFDASGVSGIIYRSNGSAGPFAKLAKVFSIPWVMLADNDEQGRQTVGEVRNCGYSEDVISSQVLLNSTTDFENELATSNRIFTDYESIVVEEITQDIIELKNSGDVDEYKKEIVKLVQKGKVVNAYKLLDLWSGNALSADDIPEVYVNAILGVCE